MYLQTSYFITLKIIFARLSLWSHLFKQYRLVNVVYRLVRMLPPLYLEVVSFPGEQNLSTPGEPRGSFWKITVLLRVGIQLRKEILTLEGKPQVYLLPHRHLFSLIQVAHLNKQVVRFWFQCGGMFQVIVLCPVQAIQMQEVLEWRQVVVLVYCRGLMVIPSKVILIQLPQKQCAKIKNQSAPRDCAPQVQNLQKVADDCNFEGLFTDYCVLKYKDDSIDRFSDYYFRDSFEHSSSESQLIDNSYRYDTTNPSHRSSRSQTPLPHSQLVPNSSPKIVQNRPQKGRKFNTIGAFLPVFVAVTVLAFVVIIIILEVDFSFFDIVRNIPEIITFKHHLYEPIKTFFKNLMS